jgi:hypothetical protein
MGSAYGQIALNIHGVKIKSESSDPETRIARLAFINDASAEPAK